MKHTPTPWTWINVNSQKDRLGHLFGDGEMILDTPEFIYGKPEDAAFIEKACNNHERLLLALKDLEIESSFAENKHHDLEDSIMRAKEAIKAAEE